MPHANSPRLGRRWRRSDFGHDPVFIAQALLGCFLIRTLDSGERVGGRIVETEAYAGVDDRAAHSFGGRRTPRNEAMYARAGTAYVYFTYGMHNCFNVVCGAPGEPVAVLVRALEPVFGLPTMRKLRGLSEPASVRLLASGPGRLCQALSIDLSFNYADLTHDPRVYIAHPPRVARALASGQQEPERAEGLTGRATDVRSSSRQLGQGLADDASNRLEIVRTPRIGVAYAAEWANRPLRFVLKKSPYLSRPVRASPS